MQRNTKDTFRISNLLQPIIRQYNKIEILKKIENILSETVFTLFHLYTYVKFKLSSKYIM